VTGFDKTVSDEDVVDLLGFDYVTEHHDTAVALISGPL
jgi:hypothetical protein